MSFLRCNGAVTNGRLNAVRTGLMGIALAVLQLVPGGMSAQVVTEFITGITQGTAPTFITAGPDGNLWFTESNPFMRGAIARITPSGVVTEFPVNTINPQAHPLGITAGPDGNLWFGEQFDFKIGKITINGAITEHPGTSGVTGKITVGSDNNLWFTESLSIIGRITTDGFITEFTNGMLPNATFSDITAGPDGNLWFTDSANDAIGKITTAGAVTMYGAGITAGSFPKSITTGPDGNLWFTETLGQRVGRITPAGLITEFSAGITPGFAPLGGIVGGPDGNVWFTLNGGAVARITPTGVITQFSAGINPSAGPYGITIGPDHNIWFVEHDLSRIGRMTIPGTAAPGLVGAASRKSHATAGAFNLPL